VLTYCQDFCQETVANSTRKNFDDMLSWFAATRECNWRTNRQRDKRADTFIQYSPCYA